MDLAKLPKTKKRGQKRVGRGIGTGKGGHTVGRGSKGQKSRGKVAAIFEGTKIKKSLLKRLPLLRGKGKFKSHGEKGAILNLKYLNLFKTQEEVTVKTLVGKGIFGPNFTGPVKILGEGEIKVPLVVKLVCSKGAKAKIEKAGGKVELSEVKVAKAKNEPKKPATKKDE